MVMGFQKYSSLPRHLRGMLGLSPELDSATYSGSSRTQVCTVTVVLAITMLYNILKHVSETEFAGFVQLAQSEISHGYLRT